MDGEANEESYELTLVGDGLSLSRRIPAAVARAILNIVMGGEPDVVPPPGRRHVEQTLGRIDGTPAGRGGAERQSLREYLDDHEATRNPDKITAIGNYLVEQEVMCRLQPG